MDGQSGRKFAAHSSFASPLTETGSDMAAANDPDWSARAKAVAHAESQEPCGRLTIHPGKA